MQNVNSFQSFLLILYLFMRTKYCLQGYLGNCAYHIANRKMTKYLHENPFEVD